MWFSTTLEHIFDSYWLKLKTFSMLEKTINVYYINLSSLWVINVSLWTPIVRVLLYKYISLFYLEYIRLKEMNITNLFCISERSTLSRRCHFSACRKTWDKSRTLVCARLINSASTSEWTNVCRLCNISSTSFWV